MASGKLEDWAGVLEANISIGSGSAPTFLFENVFNQNYYEKCWF